MIYVYNCPSCDTKEEIIKPLSQIDEVEYCSQGHTMTRILSWQGQMKMGDLSFVPMYQPAFGKVISSPRQLKDQLRRENGEKGVELVEVGNERPKYTPKRKEYDYDSAGRELHQKLRKIRKK